VLWFITKCLRTHNALPLALAFAVHVHACTPEVLRCSVHAQMIVVVSTAKKYKNGKKERKKERKKESKDRKKEEQSR
jgi:hypothetical protein